MAVSSDLQLELYNNALVFHLGERKLKDLASKDESRLLLDQAWKNGRFIIGALEESDWTFGVRTIELTYEPGIEPDFGFPYAFTKPDDWVRTVAISADPNFINRLDETGFVDENGFWFTYPQTIYVQYISNDDAYGLDTSKWPEYFTDWLEILLAKKICKRDTQSTSLYDAISADEKRALINAKGKNGMNKSAVKMDRGSWNKARNTSRLRATWSR